MDVFARIDALPPLSPEERQVLESVKTLSRKQIAARAAHYDEAGEFPWENVKALAELGLNGIFLPQSLGGAGFSYAAYLACVKEISAACASTGIIWATNFHATKPLLEFGTPEQQQRLFPPILAGGLAALVITEPSAGSDATGMTTTFTPEGDQIVINGGKTFITNGDVADLYLVFGKWSSSGAGRDAISALFIEKGTPGLRGPRRRTRWATAPPTPRRSPSRIAACRAPTCSGSRARGCGCCSRRSICRGPAWRLMRWASRCSVRGRGRLRERAPARAASASSSTRACSSCWRTWRPSWPSARRGCGTSRGWWTPACRDIGVEASMLKMRAADLAMRIATEAVQLHGGYGYIKEYRVERLMRDAKITQIWEGTSQMHRQVIGRSLMRK